MNEIHRDTENKSKVKTIKKLVPLCAIFVIAAVLTTVIHNLGEPLSAETVLKYTPQKPVLAAVILILFFALKSLTIIWPLSILYLASGILFSPVLAVLVSTAGLAVAITVPYWLRRYVGKLNDPFSTEFLVILLCRILVSLGSIVVNRILSKKKK